MDEVKTLGYDWEFGHKELIVKVDAYATGHGLYVGLYHMVGGKLDDFGDLTVNLPEYPTEINEAYINGDFSKDKLAFIKKHKLGKKLPDVGRSGLGKYAKVAFDLKRLAELDPEGMEYYRELRGIPEKCKQCR